MAGKSDYLENKLQDFTLRGQAFAPAATLYVALFTSAPTDAGGGTEVSGGGYARVAVAGNMTNWSGTQGAGSTVASSGTGGQISNNANIIFGLPSGSWGTITHFALIDSATSGGSNNYYYWGTVTPNITIGSGNGTPTFAPGTLTITED
jgi:hypothetical protein